MSHDGYRGQGQQDYGQYNPYAQQGNPYDNPSQEYGNNQSNRGYHNQQQTGTVYHNTATDVEQGAGRYEMTNMNGTDPNAILNEVRAIDRGVDEIEANLQRLHQAQERALVDTDGPQSEANKALDAINADTIAKYRALVPRLTAVKQKRDSAIPRNAAQVGKVDRRLKAAINQYQQAERSHRNKLTEMAARQYRIVRPDASDAEVREAVESDSNQQFFSDALINSNRRGQVLTVKNEVTNRHLAIQKIERDMMILAQLFQDLEAAVIRDEPAVVNIDNRAAAVKEDMVGANVQLTSAVKSAAAARRKKWWCLLICLLIIIIIVAVVVVVVKVVVK